MNKRAGVLVFFLGVFLLFASGCAKHVAKCTAPEDNPQHHYLQGMKLLEQGKLADAEAKFDRAKYCEDDYAPAYAGLSIVSALRSKESKEEGYRKVDVDKSMDRLSLAKKYSKSPEDEFARRVASMRINTVLKQKNWLEDSEDDYKEAMKLKVDENKLLYYDGREAASYFMGLAYLEARQFQHARDRFSDVLGAKKEGKWNAPADKAWKKTDKIVRALAGITVGDVGKEMALKDSISRADMAALFVDELKLDKLFAGRIPVKSQTDKMKADFTPADVLNNQFKDEILTAMKWNVRGLEPVYDATTKAYLFKPEEGVSRKEFALMTEDVLVKLTGDEKLATSFFGQDKSPFPDVAPTAAWYNAVMNATTRHIMETELSGEFRPEDKVDGAEALLAVRALRQALNIY